MALHFLVEDAAALASDEVVLTGTEAHHAAVVRRVRPGEVVTLGDGAGAWHSGEVVEATPKTVRVTVTERTHVAAPEVRITLVQALAKGDRDELAVQAATELGVDRIVPWQAARSVSRWEGPKIKKGVQRWQSIVREASKQAHRAWVPEVAEPMTTKQLSALASTQLMLVLDPWVAVPLSQVELSGATDVVIVIGPEGGIAPEELATLTAAGARAVVLGESVLRTSTAGPAAIAVASVALGRW